MQGISQDWQQDLDRRTAARLGQQFKSAAQQLHTFTDAGQASRPPVQQEHPGYSIVLYMQMQRRPVPRARDNLFPKWRCPKCRTQLVSDSCTMR